MYLKCLLFKCNANAIDLWILRKFGLNMREDEESKNIEWVVVEIWVEFDENLGFIYRLRCQ